MFKDNKQGTLDVEYLFLLWALLQIKIGKRNAVQAETFKSEKPPVWVSRDWDCDVYISHYPQVHTVYTDIQISINSLYVHIMRHWVTATVASDFSVI
jgi:hypothetical protein